MSVLWLESGNTMKYSLSPWEIPPALPSGSGYILLYIPSLVPDSVLLSKHSGKKLFTFLLEFNKYDNAFNNATVQSEIGGRSWWRESQIIFLKVSAAVLVSSSSSSSSSSAYHDFTSFGKVCWPLAAESLVSYTISFLAHIPFSLQAEVGDKVGAALDRIAAEITLFFVISFY